MVPVLAAYTAYSLADKPALAPGFAAGLAANMIGSGFLGAVVGGLIAGYLMRWVKNHLRLISKFNGFLTFISMLGTLGAGSLMLFVVGEPVAWINNSLTAWLNGLSGSNALLLGAILGFMCSFDLGGPVNKLCILPGRNGERRLRPVCHFRLRQNGFGIYRNRFHDARTAPV